MKDLFLKVEEFIQSEKIEIIQKSENLIIGRTRYFGQLNYMLFWVFPTLDLSADESNLLELKLIGEFNLYTKQYPRSDKFLVSHSREYSKKFQGSLKEFKIEQRTENQFFDTSYKYQSDSGKTSASLINRVADPKIINLRIPQPFIETNLDGDEISHGDDLLPQLLNFRQFESPDLATLNIIVGPAGAGKTYLFNALFYELHNYFIKKKNQREVFPRPIPLIPEYLKEGKIIRTDNLLQAFIDNEVATNLQLETFKWMVVNNYSSWLFDGLDELYSEDDQFFYDILDMVDQVRSKAQIFMFSRDSLLTSSKNFYEFLDTFMSSDSGVNIKLYKLTDWNNQTKKMYAWLRLFDTLPQKEIGDPPEVSQFMSFINSTESLKQISSLPYYCFLLFNEYHSSLNQSRDVYSKASLNASTLLENVVQNMVDREIEKGLISHEIFLDKKDGLDEWLRTIGLEFYKQGSTSLRIDEIEFYSQIVLSETLLVEEKRDALTALSQFPLFTKNGSVGLISFKHELLAEYLATRYLLTRLKDDPLYVGKTIGRRKDFYLSLMAEMLSSALRNKKDLFYKIIDLLVSQTLSDPDFSNLLQICIYAADTVDQKEKITRLAFNGRDISNVHFIDLDLAGTNFISANLSRTIFENCELNNVNFNFAHFIGTRFIFKEKSLFDGAVFGGLENFSYFYVNNKKVEDSVQARKWISEVSKQMVMGDGPCPTAQRYRFLFEKYIYRNGVPKIHQHLYSALIAGRKFNNAAPIEDCIDACIKFGYLFPPNDRTAIRRSEGEKWNEIVNFVTNLKLSKSMRAMFDKTCPTKNCPHVPN